LEANSKDRHLRGRINNRNIKRKRAQSSEWGFWSENDSSNRHGDRFGTQFHRKSLGIQLVQFDNVAVMSVARGERGLINWHQNCEISQNSILNMFAPLKMNFLAPVEKVCFALVDFN
jgi:hypothetical protein